METAPSAHAVASRSARRGWKRIVLLVAGLYVLGAYLLAPWYWEWATSRHPVLDDEPRVTVTGDGHPGDPVNVALVGDEALVKQIFQKAGWDVAAKLGLESDLKIAADTILSRPDNQAPVSKLFLLGRMEDLAFEHPVGHSPRQRHHVRFWKLPEQSPDGRPMWLGSASFDERVGLSHTTGQITHHISGQVDAERDFLMGSLQSTGWLLDDWLQAGFHTVRQGRNGGGDEWTTDGDLRWGVIREVTPDAAGAAKKP